MLEIYARNDWHKHGLCIIFRPFKSEQNLLKLSLSKTFLTWEKLIQETKLLHSIAESNVWSYAKVEGGGGNKNVLLAFSQNETQVTTSKCKIIWKIQLWAFFFYFQATITSKQTGVNGKMLSSYIPGVMYDIARSEICLCAEIFLPTNIFFHWILKIKHIRDIR